MLTLHSHEFQQITQFYGAAKARMWYFFDTTFETG